MAARLPMTRRSFRLSLPLDVELERIARRTGQSPSELIRELITDGLQRQPPPTPEQLEKERREELEEMKRAAEQEEALLIEEERIEVDWPLEAPDADLQMFLQMMEDRTHA